MNFASENFGVIWPRHVDGIIRLLTSLRQAFGGDLDSVLILAVIGSAALPQGKLPPDLSYPEFTGGSDRDRYASPLNTNSIADITGIPRESVRRKLLAMESKKWVQRGDNGYWEIGPNGASDLQPMTDLSLEYLSSIAEVIRSA
ncbi:hypothetical protein [Qipengyuania zhejiangensis]|uniref:hypothetical protein n=1 Tax=Qipengyuania zhejiangensis TaxID=3077782 RepID=UPI002D789823|nr:hypothetical protein [Qipengyuania sp. Z2]